MTNKEQQALIREAIDTMGKAFTILASALGAQESEAPAHGKTEPKVSEAPVKETKKEEPKKAPVNEEPKVEPVQEAPNTTVEVDIPEDLESLSYNELKQLAKKVGVKAVGSKKDLISAISGGEVQEAPKKEAKKETKKAEPVEESLEVAEEESNVIPMDRSKDVKEPEKTQEDTTLYDRIVSDLEGYSDEELADILSDIGVSPRGKRQALLAKIVTAIEEGKLEWEEDEETTEVEDTVPVQEEDNASDEEVAEEILGSDERKKAVEALRDELTDAYNNDDLTDKEILTYLKKYYNNNYTSNDPIEDAELYIEIQCNLIDDEGEAHEFEDPYYIGDDAYCCGLQLKQINDTDLYCEHCGTTYGE